MAATRNGPGPAAELLERPLTARSVIASLLLGRHPPSAPVALLVRWCALMGVSETSTRVALSRMVERGELATAGGTYELVGRMRDRQADQDAALAVTLAPAGAAWDGTWLLATVADGRRAAADRVALREAMRRCRMVAWRDGVWLRPDNLGGLPGTAADREVVDAQCVWWRARPEDRPRVDIDVTAAFDVDALAARGAVLRDRLRDATLRLHDDGDAGVVLGDAFVVGAAAAQHLRRDPLLPAELLPRRWPNDELRRAYAAYTPVLGAAIRAWSSTAA